ncbi:MAG: hypothetical protein L6W00_05335 [Lentisphaeria bacterium]|nr:MAG: hypothetical protein L6W00_05335 [Lentisphaeria bacterium]
MFGYLVKRLILAAFTLLTILLVSYVLLRLAPGDPTRSDLFSSDGGMTAVNAEEGPSGRTGRCAKRSTSTSRFWSASACGCATWFFTATSASPPRSIPAARSPI